MKKNKNIEKLYEDSLGDTSVHDYVENTVDWIRQCESNNLIHKIKDDIHLSICKVKDSEDKPYIRMVFVIKDKVRGRVRNIERITDIIRDVERVVSFVDKVKTHKSDNLVYLDMLKAI